MDAADVPRVAVVFLITRARVYDSWNGATVDLVCLDVVEGERVHRIDTDPRARAARRHLVVGTSDCHDADARGRENAEGGIPLVVRPTRIKPDRRVVRGINNLA